MKKILLPIVAVAVLAACNNSSETKSTGFELKGKFANSSGETILLQELTPKGATTIDTAKTNENGEFAFVKAHPKMGFYNVMVNERNFATLILDSNQQVTLSGNAQDLGNTYQVEGSVDTKVFLEFNRSSMSILKKQDSLRKVYERVLNLSKTTKMNMDSLDKTIGDQFDALSKQQAEFIRTFIGGNMNSIASLAAIQQLSPDEDFELYVKLNDSLSKKFPTSAYVQMFTETVENLKKVTIGSVAPELNLNTPEGKPVALSSLRGKYVLIDFWASWCGPCRAENPNVVKAYNKFKSKGFDIYGVSLDKDKDKWVEAIKKDNLTWTHVSDLLYWNSSVIKLYGFNAIPTNFLLDKEGKIIAKNMRGEDLEKKLAEVIK